MNVTQPDRDPFKIVLMALFCLYGLAGVLNQESSTAVLKGVEPWALTVWYSAVFLGCLGVFIGSVWPSWEGWVVEQAGCVLLSPVFLVYGVVAAVNAADKLPYMFILVSGSLSVGAAIRVYQISRIRKAVARHVTDIGRRE